MPQINVSDVVEIVKAGPSEQHVLHKVGRVMMIVDGTKAFVTFSDGGGASVTVDQLRKVE
jgi:hypothetical protein